MIIILEGPDCCGKTTLGRALLDHGDIDMLFHCTWTPALSEGIFDYMDNVIENALVCHQAGKTVVLDRSWPSEFCYGLALDRPSHKERLFWFATKRSQLAIPGVKYVFCYDELAKSRHTQQIDNAHPYTEEQYDRVVRAYHYWKNEIMKDYHVISHNILKDTPSTLIKELGL